MQQVMDSKWYTGGAGCIGIVLVLGTDGLHRVYIGAGFGRDEDSDARHIAALGARLEYHVAKAFYPQLQEEAYGGPV